MLLFLLFLGYERCKFEKWPADTEFKIPTVNSGFVAAIHVAGVRCDPCGAMRCNVGAAPSRKIIGQWMR